MSGGGGRGGRGGVSGSAGRVVKGGSGVAAAAASQGGVVTRSQLLACGVTDEQISHAVGRDALVRIGRGIYRDATLPGGWPGELWCAVLAAGPYAFAFRRAAAALWELDGTEPAVVEVAVARERHPARHSGAHRLSNLRPGEVVRLDGLRTTSPLRTLLDLATIEDAPLLERAVESAIRLGLTTDGALRAQPPPLRRGHRTWREVLADRPVGAPATESDGETRFAQLCRAGGLPEPVRQHEVHLGRRFRLDFAWPLLRLAVEIDGRAVHGPDALGPDLRRQNRIQLAGWLILRFTYEDVVDYPDETVRILRDAFRLLALRDR